MLSAGGCHNLTSLSFIFEFIVKSFYDSQTLVQRPFVKREIALSQTKVSNIPFAKCFQSFFWFLHSEVGLEAASLLKLISVLL